MQYFLEKKKIKVRNKVKNGIFMKIKNNSGYGIYINVTNLV